jgi:hypothetical protein
MYVLRENVPDFFLSIDEIAYCKIDEKCGEHESKKGI